MIIVVNLALPRKKIEEKFNDILFKAKLNDFDLCKYTEILVLLVLGLTLDCTKAYAKETYLAENMHDRITELVKVIGYPTVDSVFQLMKLKGWKEYIKYKFSLISN